MIVINANNVTVSGDVPLAVTRRLDVIEHYLRVIVAQGEVEMREIDELADQVTQKTDAEAAAIQLLNGIAAQIQRDAADATKMLALADKLKTSSKALSEAIAANTTPQPAPTAGAGEAQVIGTEDVGSIEDAGIVGDTLAGGAEPQG
jgi:hypothetical protein